ncbi:hypothetical protein MPSEU_000937400 [Mayamaea pseudoterrestris]|nr:hypothetical protein MPSEU_000937400 [Mayamaea pseudoterrestris]
MATAKNESPTLFDRLGGVVALRAAVEEFYKRLLDDPKLYIMFEDVKMPLLKYHQLAFMKIAFSKIPDDLDVAELILQKHMRLFLNKGLNETHFDIVAQHFVETLHHLGIGNDLVNEAAGIIVPLRPVFQKGALLKLEQDKAKADGKASPVTTIVHDQTHHANEPTLIDRLGGNDMVKAAVKSLYERMLDDPMLEPFFESINLAQLKHHQISFLKIAFTQVPSDLDVTQYLGQTHARLIQEQGLNAMHFDRMLSHFANALIELNVSEGVIQEAASAIGAFRVVFEAKE